MSSHSYLATTGSKSVVSVGGETEAVRERERERERERVNTQGENVKLGRGRTGYTATNVSKVIRYEWNFQSLI